MTATAAGSLPDAVLSLVEAAAVAAAGVGTSAPTVETVGGQLPDAKLALMEAAAVAAAGVGTSSSIVETVQGGGGEKSTKASVCVWAEGAGNIREGQGRTHANKRHALPHRVF